MNRLDHNELQVKWYNEACFEFLKAGANFTLSKNISVPISIFINTPSPIDINFASVADKFSIVKRGIDGICNGLYVSYYFNGDILIITDVDQGITAAKISHLFCEENRRLFLTSLIRNHVIRHYIHVGLMVYHASAIVENNTSNAILILGKSGSGKTTFALEAVKSGNYSLLSEDKVILDPLNNNLFGSAVVHLKETGLIRYGNYVKNLSLINGGTTEKKYQGQIHSKLHVHSGVLKEVIILNQDDFSLISSFHALSDLDKIRRIFDISQKNIYITSEKQAYLNAYSKLLCFPLFELYHNSFDINYHVFERRKVETR